MRLSLLVCGLLPGALTMMAQDAGPTLSARILEIHRDKIRPSKVQEYRSLEAIAAANCGRNGCAKPYLTLMSITGEPEVWQISTWERFGVMENGDIRYPGPSKASRVLESVEESSTAIAIYREDLSGPPAISLAAMRYFSISVVEVRPGKTGDYEEVRRLIRAARLRMGAKDTNFVYQVVSGMRDGTFVIITPMRHLREAEEIRPMMGQSYDTAMGDTDRGKLRALIAETVRRSQGKLFLASAEMSYPPAEWRSLDGGFWLAIP